MYLKLHLVRNNIHEQRLDTVLFANSSHRSIGPCEKTAGLRAPEIRKAGRLGNDRPSLGARLGVELSKPWGVWEGGFDERPGEPPAGIGKLGGCGALIQKRCQ